MAEHDNITATDGTSTQHGVNEVFGYPAEQSRHALRSITPAEELLTDFDPAAPYDRKLYGYATRHFVNVDRFTPLTRFDREDPEAVERAAHFEKLVEASGQFLAGIGKLYGSEHGVDTRAVITKAFDDVLALHQRARIPDVSVEPVQISSGVL